MARNLRWGLIGASDIAATRMIPAMRAMGDQVVGLVSGDEQHASRYAGEHQLDVATTDLDAFLARDDVDAVYISSTNEKHFDQATAALLSGKHVLCEKPVALTMADAIGMVECAEKTDRVFAVNHHLPGAGTQRTVQRLVRDGAIGTPLAVRVAHSAMLPERLRGWRLSAQPGGGVILDITCHDASVINAILELDAVSVSTTAVHQGPWDSASFDAAMSSIRYSGDVLAQTHDAFTIAFPATGVEVYGTEGTIIASGVMSQDPVGDVRLIDKNGGHEIHVADRRDLYHIIIEAFDNATRGEGRPTVTGTEAAKALAVALAAQESAETGRPIAVPAATGNGS